MIAIFSSVALSQPERGTIRGLVLDEGTRQPLVGVNITVKGTVLGTASDHSGSFVLRRVPVGGQILYFSMLGYERKQIGPVEVRADRDRELEIHLKASAIGDRHSKPAGATNPGNAGQHCHNHGG